MGRHRDPIRPDHDTLAELCKTKNATQIAAIYGKEVKTVCGWLKSEGLKAQPNINKIRPKRELNMPHVVRLANS